MIEESSLRVITDKIESHGSPAGQHNVTGFFNFVVITNHKICVVGESARWRTRHRVIQEGIDMQCAYTVQ